MTADVEPLPEYLRRDYKVMPADSHEAECKHYARVCVAHATAAKDAEIEALLAEVETLRDGLDYLRQMQGAPDVLELRAKAARAERLAEALRSILEYIEEGGYGFEYTCERVARAALHPTAAQENDDA